MSAGDDTVSFDEFRDWLNGFIAGASNLTPAQCAAIRRELSRVVEPVAPLPIVPSVQLVPVYTPAPAPAYTPAPKWPWSPPYDIWCKQGSLGPTLECAFNGCGAV